MSKIIGPDERMLILDRLDAGVSAKDISFELGRDIQSIYRVARKYHPTTKLATRLILANSERLAKRIIDKANVEESIDILSRPNVDVLKPVIREAPVNVGFFTSVSLDAVGAVREVKSIGLGATDAVTRSQIPDEGRSTLSLQGESSGGGEEYEVGRYPHAEGVRAGRDASGNAQAHEEAGEQESLIVGPPSGYVPDSVSRTRTKKKEARAARPKPTFVDPHPSRKAILKLAKGHTTKGNDNNSSIHLRYDI